MEWPKALFDYYIDAAHGTKILLVGLFSWLYFVRNKPGCRKIICTLEQSTRVLLWILLIAFALRLGWALWSPHIPPAAHTEDAAILMHARQLATGSGFNDAEGRPSAHRPIGYPFFVSLVFRMFGENFRLVEFLQAGMGVLSVWILFLLTRRLTNQATASIAALIFALNPSAVFSTKLLMDEHLFMPLWLLGILFLVWDLETPRMTKVILAGVSFGLAAHIRTHAFAMGGIAFAAWWLLGKDWRRGLVRFVVIQAAVLTFAIPWAVRNYLKMGSPILYSTSFGLSMYYANNENPLNVNYPLEQGGDPAFILARSEAEQHEAGKRAALRWIRKNPGTFLDRSIRRILFMVGLQKEGWVVNDNFHTIEPGRRMPPERLIKAFEYLDYNGYRLLFLSAFVGMVIYLWRWKKWSEEEKRIGVVILTIFYYVGSVFLVLGLRKYRFPLEPLFSILSAYLFFITGILRPSLPTRSFRAHDPVAL